MTTVNLALASSADIHSYTENNNGLQRLIKVVALNIQEAIPR